MRDATADGGGSGTRTSSPLPFEGDPLALAVVAAATLAVSAAAVGCAGPERPADELTAQQEQAVADTIESLTENLASTWGELDPDAYLQLFSDDVQFYFQGWNDREQFEESVRQIMPAYREYPMEITDQRIEVLGRDAAVATLTYRAEPVDTAGRSREGKAAFTLVYERRDGSWKVVQAHESLISEEETE